MKIMEKERWKPNQNFKVGKEPDSTFATQRNKTGLQLSPKHKIR